ncbi:MAG: aldose 1-epimerase [Pseudomonadaceae bacterium]|nr:aldose 1-epimerase [Pseudomonadaceae bacterium]
MTIVSLEHADWALQLDPALGGSVLRLQHCGADLLRTAVTPCNSPLESAAFPLLPFVGRIDQGRFVIGDETIELGATPGAGPHALHGHGWRGRWNAQMSYPDRVVLDFEHMPDAWPWHYCAQQVFVLSEEALTLNLSISNRSAEPMPAGLGWHPYFAKSGARLYAPVQRWWPGGADSTPTRSQEIARSGMLEQVDVTALFLDNAFQRFGQHASIEWPERGQRLDMETSANLGHCLVYTPANADYFCFEPVSHAPNAHNSLEGSAITGLRWLRQGETMSASVQLSNNLTHSG